MPSRLFCAIIKNPIFAERVGLFCPSTNWRSIIAVAEEPNVKEFYVQVPSCDETAIYFPKGGVPNWDQKDIYLIMMQFTVIQLIGVILILFYHKLFSGYLIRFSDYRALV